MDRMSLADVPTRCHFCAWTLVAKTKLRREFRCARCDRTLVTEINWKAEICWRKRTENIQGFAHEEQITIHELLDQKKEDACPPPPQTELLLQFA